MKHPNIPAGICLLVMLTAVTAACAKGNIPNETQAYPDTVETGIQEVYEDTETDFADTSAPLEQPAEQYSFDYLLSAKVFASNTQLYFSPIDANDRTLTVYHTEGAGKSMQKTEYMIPEEYQFDKAVVICCGYGAGSGECQFLIKLTNEDAVEYLAYNNFTWGIDQSYLEFRCAGILSDDDAENYYNDAKYKAEGVEFERGSTVSDDLDIPTAAELEAQGVSHASGIYDAICALLSGDIDGFASACDVAPEVYDEMRGMKLGAYRVYVENIPVTPDSSETNAYPVLELEVLESDSDFFTPGIHSLVFDEGLVVTFAPREGYSPYGSSTRVSHAQKYVKAVGSEDFYVLGAEGRMQFGLCDFIVARLDTLAGKYEPRTKEEICEYAEKYLGVDGETLNIEKSLEKVDGGYIRIGRGVGPYISTFLSEEIRDGITVVTVQYWADYSKTVPSKTVEYHMELIDGEYRPIKSVIIMDSGLATVYLAT